MLLGVVAAVRRGERPGLILDWTVMGLGFFIALGPKLIDHDYYELMLLPAAAAWGARGLGHLLDAVARQDQARRRAWGLGLLGLALIVQSPAVMRSLFELEWGKRIVAERLARLGPQSGRVVAIGPGVGLGAILHYSGREGWPVHSATLAADWREAFDRYRAQGGTLAVLYFGPDARREQCDSYRPLLASCPVVERGAGPWARGGRRCEYLILDLRPSPDQSASEAKREPPYLELDSGRSSTLR
jgi:hypothetical protein